LRHVKGRAQTGQSLAGRFDFAMPFGISDPHQGKQPHR
jgi:hypothetical protein